ncbi:TorF family putative porin [Aliidiomarina soli]|uniref:TorF family putative porin n=1 Tax=Aliidiomarina soli TaxID=1928574 RepID=UPI0023AAC5F2|nr:TorF family putative porin [Aliidiomarina soli]
MLGLSSLCYGSPLLAGTAPVTWDNSVTVTSDYLFNGVSQTSGNPAFQLESTVSAEYGGYVGIFASNVDFGDETDLEFDAYAGWFTQLNESWSFDVTALYYTYHGANYSSDGNYPEVMMALGYHNLRFATWYSWDYFGTGAGHMIGSVSYHIAVSEPVSIEVGYTRSTSLDSTDYQWDDSRGYDHVYAQLSRDWEQFSIGGSINHATLSSQLEGGTRLNVYANYQF